MKKLSCIILCFLIVFSVAGCKNKTDSATKAYINYNLQTEPSSLDPQIASDYASRIVIMSMFEGLVRIDADGSAMPGVAESWTPNSDYTSFTFKLRNDATWSNEQKLPLTAQDFVFGFSRALLPQTGSDTGRALYCIKNARMVNSGSIDISNLGVYVVDDKTLTIDLEYPYQDFPKLTAISAAMPCNESFFNTSNGQYGLEYASVLGNGPYAFTNRYSWDHGKSLALSKNDNYHGSSAAIPAGINFTIASEMSNNANAIVNGSIDASPIPGEQINIAKNNAMKLTSFEDTTWGLCFNMSDAIFQNINVRRGFIGSLDRNYILSNIPENYTQANDIITPETTVAGSFYRDLAGGDFYLSYNENARNQLNTGLTQTGQDSMPNVTVSCLDTVGTKTIVSSMIEIWNRNLGTYFNMKPMSLNDLNSEISSGSYQIALAPLKAENDGPLEFLSIFKSDNLANPAKLKDISYDRILAKIAENPGDAGVSYCVEAEKYLNNNAVFYPLCYEKRFFATASNVTNIIFHPYEGGIDFMYARKEEKI